MKKKRKLPPPQATVRPSRPETDLDYDKKGFNLIRGEKHYVAWIFAIGVQFGILIGFCIAILLNV